MALARARFLAWVSVLLLLLLFLLDLELAAGMTTGKVEYVSKGEPRNRPSSPR